MKKKKSKILKFNELTINHKEFKLDQFQKDKDEKYSFEKRDINELYDCHIFQVLAKEIVCDPRGFLIIHCIVTIKNKDYGLSIVYDTSSNIHYASTDEKELKELKSKIDIDELNYVTNNILDDEVPMDFWEVKTKYN